MCLCEIISSQARFLAWDQAPEKGEKIGVGEKEVGEQSEPKGSLGRGRDVGAAPPFFDFFPRCGAWSQANGFRHSHSSCAGFLTQLKRSSLLEVIFTIYLAHNSRKFMNK